MADSFVDHIEHAACRLVPEHRARFRAGDVPGAARGREARPHDLQTSLAGNVLHNLRRGEWRPRADVEGLAYRFWSLEHLVSSVTRVLFRPAGPSDLRLCLASAAEWRAVHIVISESAQRLPRELPHVLSATLCFSSERSVARATLVVPGHCRAVLAYLLRNGFRYGDSINLLLASRPFGHMDRYLLSAVDALL